jgi:hypothetical protein
VLNDSIHTPTTGKAQFSNNGLYSSSNSIIDNSLNEGMAVDVINTSDTDIIHYNFGKLDENYSEQFITPHQSVVQQDDKSVNRRNKRVRLVSENEDSISTEFDGNRNV